MNRRHHHTCRCNDCVRRRNAARRRAEWRDLERGMPRPSGSTLYEVMRDLPPIYEDEVQAREQNIRRIIEETAHSAEHEPDQEAEERLREEQERERRAEERLREYEAQQQEEESSQQAEETDIADPDQQSPVGGQRQEGADGQRWRRAQEQYLEAARQQREEEERRRQARAASREAARRLREEEENRQIREYPTPSDGAESDDRIVPTPTEAVSNPVQRRTTWRRLAAPVLISVVVLFVIFGIGLLTVAACL